MSQVALQAICRPLYRLNPRVDQFPDLYIAGCVFFLVFASVSPKESTTLLTLTSISVSPIDPAFAFASKTASVSSRATVI